MYAGVLVSLVCLTDASTSIDVNNNTTYLVALTLSSIAVLVGSPAFIDGYKRCEALTMYSVSTSRINRERFESSFFHKRRLARRSSLGCRASHQVGPLEVQLQEHNSISNPSSTK